MWTRRELLRAAAAAPFALTACGSEGEPDPVRLRARGEAAFTSASRWLWAQRGREGAWRTDFVPDIVSGHVLTPLCLLHTTELPRDDFPHPRQDALRSCDWIVDHQSRGFALGFESDPPEHPTWANALAIHAMSRMRPTRLADTTSPMLWWLRRQQVGAETGDPDHPDAGAFCQGFFRRRPPGAPIRVDLHRTRLAMAALDSFRVGPDDPAMRAARAWVEKCAVPGGGFAATPQAAASGAPATGPATADALLALVCADAPGEALVPHLEVLHAMHRTDRAPGPLDEAEARGRRLGYLAAAAAVFERTAGPPGWADALIEAVDADRGEDGAHRGPGGWYEDEPLIATSYALGALGGALRSWPRAETRRR